MNPLLRAAGTLVLPALFLASVFGAEKKSPPAAADYFVYFGTYTKGASKGIYRARLDTAVGRISAAELAAESPDPAFLAVHPGGEFLYAINENTDPKRTPGKGVSAFSLNGRTGSITLLNEQSPGGSGPCHLAVDPDGKCVLVANYGGGSVAALPLAADGRVGAPASFIQHEGSSVNPTRQQAPHAHGIYVAPGKSFVLSPDLGIDRVLVYRLDAGRPSLTPHAPPSVSVAPGSGPRHLAFHPGGRFVYVINELLCTVSVFAFDAGRGELKERQTISTLPPGESVKAGTSTAEIAVHPGGKYVYGSNRGHDSIVVYAADPATGRLTHLENTPTQGKTPRHFAIDPTGRWLLAENQASDTVVVFAIDPHSGKLKPTGQSLAVPSPVCAVFVPVRS